MRAAKRGRIAKSHKESGLTVTQPSERPEPQISSRATDTAGGADRGDRDDRDENAPDVPGSSKAWRLAFAFLLTITGAFIGYFAGTALLLIVAEDPALRRQFPDWLTATYTVIFIAVGAIFGFALGGAVFKRIEAAGETLRGLSGRDKVFLIGGVFVGLLLTAVISLPIITLLSKSQILAVVVSLLVGVAVTYLSTAAALSMKEDFHLYIPPSEDNALPKEKFKILDTNVIIDGRIADVAKAGFIDGPLYIPGFVLDELRHIADSADDNKRARGRRGLEILNVMEKELPLVVRQYDKLAPQGGDVDNRLVQLAKTLDASLVTNDWNLNRAAEVEKVSVLNINALALAMKPIVLPGEVLSIQLIKEGKDADQGVGYLDDGTMIVVGNGRRHLGETVDVVVNSLMQTAAGKMIFAHLRDDDERHYDGGNSGGNGNGSGGNGSGGNGFGNANGPGMRPDSGSRTRRSVRRSGE